MSFLKVLRPDILKFIDDIAKMENPDIEIVKLKDYEYKGKKWQIMILIREGK